MIYDPSVCVYCGAASLVDEKFKETTRAMGDAIGRSGMTLVYGGGHTGLMGLCADSALKAGGKVVGIIPTFLKNREVMHEGVTELHVVDSMHERKMMMAERASAFVILPGGFGTLEEFFEIVSWRQLGLHDKPVIILNSHGYWDSLIETMDGMIAAGFATPRHREAYTVVTSVAEVAGLLKSAKFPEVPLQTERI